MHTVQSRSGICEPSFRILRQQKYILPPNSATLEMAAPFLNRRLRRCCHDLRLEAKWSVKRLRFSRTYPWRMDGDCFYLSIIHSLTFLYI